MAQQEYMMWSPHERAKLFRRFTGNVSVQLKDSEVITIQDNRYAYVGSFKWVETTSNENSDDQPLDGLVVDNSYITIRTNSLMKFKKGDLIMLPKSCQWAGLWIIGDGARVDYAYTPKPVQTYQYLPLSNTT